MRRLLTRVLLLTTVIAVSLSPIMVKADPSGYKNFYQITITDTGGTNRTNVPVIVTGITGTDELNALRINSGGTNTDMTDSSDGSGQSYMMDTAQTMVVVPYLPANGTVVYNLYEGTTATQTEFPIITGVNGYVTTTDHANLELGSVYQLDISGYIDTSYVATPKHLVEKVNAFTLAVDAAQQITATMYTGGTPSTISVSATGVTSGEHDIRVTADGTNFKIFVDDMVTAEDTESQLVQMPFSEYFAPAGEGYTTTITFQSANPHWETQVTNDGDTSWVGDEHYTQLYWDYYTGSANTLPATATITSVVGGSITRRETTNNFAYVNVGIRMGGVDSVGAETSVTSTFDAYEDTLNRPGGGAWAVSDFDSFEMGLGLRVSSSSANRSRSTQTYIKVNYTDEDTATVPDNANNWTIGGDNTYSYLTSFNLTQGATERIHYEPAVMLTGTAVVNLASGGSYPGVITWGANSGLTVTVGALTVAPSVITNGATNLAPTTATLQGTLQGMGDYDFISVSFEYGTTVSYGGTTSETTLTNATTFALEVTNLFSGTTYHYRAVSRVSTESGDIYWYGADKSFATLLAEGSSTDIQIKSVNIFSTYSVTGDMLVCVETVNKYSDFFPNERPSDYFQVQFLDTDNVTVLGATGLPHWGDRPSAIYLSTAIAATVTPQDTHYVKLIGYGIVGSPYTEYIIQTNDWKGNDLVALDNWCTGTAKNMQINDNVDGYIATATDKSEILSDTVGAYFTTGVPGLSTIRPNLFNTNIVSGTAPLGTANDQWESANEWEANVGGLKDDIGKFAAPLGVNSRDTFGLIFWGIIVLVVIYVSKGQEGIRPVGIFLVCVPAIWAMTYLKIIPPDMIIVLFIASIILGSIKILSHIQ